MNLPAIEAFVVRCFNDGNDPPLLLECPTPECDLIPLGDLISLLDLGFAADNHIRQKHLPPLPEGQVYCAGCYSVLTTRDPDPWCDVCQGGNNGPAASELVRNGDSLTEVVVDEALQVRMMHARDLHCGRMTCPRCNGRDVE